MTNINFYKINGGFNESLMLACQLTEKAFQQGLQVLLHTGDKDVSQQLDDLLWSFRPTAFLPHAIESKPASAIAINHSDDPGEHHGLLINLSEETPGWFSRFEKAIEIVYDDQRVIESKRERFSFYKHRGYPLNFHDLSNKK
ncbi:MAG: DNA polymerase III subunit chi [Porticoccus sp.]|jgi:DNA polymerase-3 subunit chi|uniref:DNA polymerase III subunit chi n=1 Tax=Porticoccus hydrocarbonoclasticus TaxID=1073414 RepID=UPI00056BE186|nr:DNA polymerase III subunit chi [Porticoccus hydrocarbonoclasticus]MBG57442.1 DNA polymerase III subunit chi [Porticoccus sp.]|tara:strand:+ start:2560 stop:2985 length:426 start_codon:yes stop_codon:yes gene_type:complete